MCVPSVPFNKYAMVRIYPLLPEMGKKTMAAAPEYVIPAGIWQVPLGAALSDSVYKFCCEPEVAKSIVPATLQPLNVPVTVPSAAIVNELLVDDHVPPADAWVTLRALAAS